jgi:predicted nucleic acid-binding protein
VTVLDTSAVIDYLLDSGAAAEVRELVRRDSPTAAPDLLVFEVLAVLRRLVSRGDLTSRRANSALADLGDFAVELFPALPLRERAFELRDNLTAADALFVALAEALGEPIATKDRALARAAREHTRARVVLVG